MEAPTKNYRFLKYLIFFSSLPCDAVVSTSSLSKHFGVSQQTISRLIRSMESGGLISRKLVGDGQRIAVTSKGRNFMSEVQLALKASLSEHNSILFVGTVERGSGEGAYYMQQEGYVRQFKQLVGYLPFPGTLNLRVSQRDTNKKALLSLFPSTLISGFKSREREFGSIRCYACLINGSVKGHIIIPERAHHEDCVLELISEKNLMQVLGIDYGDELRVEVWRD